MGLHRQQVRKVISLTVEEDAHIVYWPIVGYDIVVAQFNVHVRIDSSKPRPDFFARGLFALFLPTGSKRKSPHTHNT